MVCHGISLSVLPYAIMNMVVPYFPFRVFGSGNSSNQRLCDGIGPRKERHGGGRALNPRQRLGLRVTRPTDTRNGHASVTLTRDDQYVVLIARGADVGYTMGHFRIRIP